VRKSQFWTAPNQITLLRLIFVPFVVINILARNFKLALLLFVLAGLSDALDGLLARWLNQRSMVGQYLDPIADKLLLSSAFLVLSFTKQIPWTYTVLVFSRDLSITLITAVLYITTSIRDFRPSIFGKLNTGAQIGAIFFVLSSRINPLPWIGAARRGFLLATLVLTCLSAFHYILITGHKLHASGETGSSTPHSR
jgi:cardiolipin synthase